MVRGNDKIGFLIEEVGFLSNMSAYENLRAQAYILNQIGAKKQIDYVMGLLHIEKSKMAVKNFSMGMKQSLGIGMALLSNHDILILDEPVNALDAEGIIEMRSILKNLNKDGKTILMSSHILGELGKISNKFGVIKDGILIEEFSKEKLDEHSRSSKIFTLDNKIGIPIKNSLDMHNISYGISENVLKIYNGENVQNIISLLNENKMNILSIDTLKDDLENYFIRLMGEY